MCGWNADVRRCAGTAELMRIIDGKVILVPSFAERGCSLRRGPEGVTWRGGQTAGREIGAKEMWQGGRELVGLST